MYVFRNTFKKMELCICSLCYLPFYPLFNINTFDRLILKHYYLYSRRLIETIPYLVVGKTHDLFVSITILLSKRKKSKRISSLRLINIFGSLLFQKRIGRCQLFSIHNIIDVRLVIFFVGSSLINSTCFAKVKKSTKKFYSRIK